MRNGLAYLLGFLLAFVALASTSAGVPPAGAQQSAPVPPPIGVLTQLADDTYSWQYRGYHTIFIVTDEGVIAADPSGITHPGAARLFRSIIESITDQPVRYLVMSHGNADHAAGSDVFTDTAVLIGTQRAAEKLAALNSPRHAVPTVIVEDYMRLELGGKVVDLYTVGPIAGGDHLIMHYPAARVLFVVDWAEPRRLPFRDMQGTASIDAWVTALEWIETSFDYDVLVPGHSPLGTKANLRENREYLRDLEGAIRAARSQGLADNSPEMVGAVRAALESRYGTWSRFDEFIAENIRGVIRIWGEQAQR